MAVNNLPDGNLIYNLQEGIAINFCIIYITIVEQIFLGTILEKTGKHGGVILISHIVQGLYDGVSCQMYIIAL
jgi:hypothetical protein